MYGTAEEQLTQLGRVIDLVPGDGNCLFESIARQTGYTHQDLRRLVYLTGRQRSREYCQFLAGDELRYLEEMEAMRCDGAWNYAVGDLVITILQEA